MGDVVADMLIRAINAPHIELLERRQVRRVLEEQAFAASDLTQPGDAARYGRLADTRFVLIGTIYRLDGAYIVSARMVDSASGVVHESSRAVVQFRTVDEMTSRVTELAQLLGIRVGAPIAGIATTAAPIAPPSTVRDYLEQVGTSERADVRVALEKAGRTVQVGEDIQFKVQSDHDGFLSLFVVDAKGNVGTLIPNGKLQCQPVRAGIPIHIPRDVPFSLRAQPPLGPTRIKAIVTRAPIPLVGSADSGDVLRRVQLSEVIGAPTDQSGNPARAQWSSAELEFLIVPVGQSAAVAGAAGTAVPSHSTVAPDSTPAITPRQFSKAHDLIRSSLRAVLSGTRALTSDDLALLRWPLKSPFDPRFDIEWTPMPVGISQDIRIAVVDADFDPDDPYLVEAFRSLKPEVREALRDEIRRNGHAFYRHGNRVASLIAGEAAWMPSVLPGATIVPIRITTAMGAPFYRADRGGAVELLGALRKSLTAGCRVVNLSLSVPLEGEELRKFSDDPIWNELDLAGVVVVCAAGNSRQNLDDQPLFPACLGKSNILCVGAIGADGALGSWAGEGSARGLLSVDLVAPGTWIVASDGGGNAGIGSGTSYACAFASGAVARMLMADPSLRPQEVIDRLVQQAKPLPELAGLTRAGLLQWPVGGR